MRYQTLAALLALAHIGCSSGNPTQKCLSLVSTLCKKAFECGAGGVYGTEVACVMKQATQLGCEDWVFPEGCTYDWTRFDTCVSDVGDQACSEAQTGQQPASCSALGTLKPICTAGGAVYCSSHSSSGSNGGCSEAHSGCTDGKSYAVVCDDTSCLCKVDGVTTQTAVGPGCSPDQAVLNAECGWNLAVTYRARDMAMSAPPDLRTPSDLSAGCTISGTFYAPNAIDPQSPCHICNPTYSTSSWAPRDGVACGSGCGMCSGGSCGPVTLATGVGQATALTLNATDIYWADRLSGYLYKMSRSGGTPVQLASGQSSIGGVAIDATSVYWVSQEGGAGVARKLPLGGGTITTLATSGMLPSSLAIDATSVYWTDQSAGTVMKVALGGGTPTQLASAQANPRGIAVDATSAYWVNNAGGAGAGNGTVMKVALGGGTPTQLASAQDGPIAIAVDANYVYWTTYRQTMRVPRGGGTVLALNATELQIAEAGLFVDATNAYWVNSIANGGVVKVSIGGGSVTEIVKGNPQLTPSHVVVDSTCAYFTWGGNVARAPK